jgi:hypothetical protein
VTSPAGHDSRCWYTGGRVGHGGTATTILTCVAGMLMC